MQQKIYDMITRLVRIPSVSSDTEQLHRIIDEVASIFQDIPGVHMKKYEFGGKPSFIVQNFVGDAADIVLAGHLDVVPAQDPSLFEPVEKDGKLWGRGCGDMKDGCALIILLMEELLRAGWNEKKISCRFTTDEET
jgi:acetylornithine deacetylase/succinyl-diaminopimelate desuccinylase-like protein